MAPCQITKSFKHRVGVEGLMEYFDKCPIKATLKYAFTQHIMLQWLQLLLEEDSISESSHFVLLPLNRLNMFLCIFIQKTPSSCIARTTAYQIYYDKLQT